VKPGVASLMLGAMLGVCSVAQAAEPPPFRLIRSDENYRYLADPSAATPGDRLRYIPLSDNPDIYLSLGGETRLRLDAFDAPRFGIGGEAADAYGLARALFSADLHLGRRVRIYGELGLHRDLDKKGGPAVSDRDSLDAQVAFIDLAPDTAQRWRLRLGRQELLLNPTQRFVSVREGPNIRQSFDGVRVTRQTAGRRLEAFYLRPVVIQTGAFDDSRNEDQRFYGVCASTTLSQAVTVDVYALELDRDGVRFGSVRGDERRSSLGARLAGKSGPIDFEAEAMVQGGRFAGRDIRAWGGSIGGGYTLTKAWSPRLGLRLDAGSGDRDAADGKLQTFNPLFPKGAYFNESGLTSWSNLVALRPSVGLSPKRDVSLEVSYLIRQSQTAGDAIYLQPSTPLAPAGSDRSRAVSHGVQLDAGWQVSRSLKLQVQALHQDAGDAVAAIGGKDVNIAMAIIQFRF